jgi:fructokinase
MDVSQVQWDDTKPTGTVPVTIDGRGVPDYTIVKDVAYDVIQPIRLAADAVCFGTLVQRSPVSRLALYRLLESLPDALHFCDLNLRRECWSGETVAGSLRRSHIVKLNDSEAVVLRTLLGLRGRTPPALAREIRRRWRLEAVVVTLGEHGAYAVTARDEAQVSGWNVEVADSIGSGDAFSAAFLHSWMRGRTLEDCCFFGNALGALVARTKGATAVISRDEINRFCGRTI